MRNKNSAFASGTVTASYSIAPAENGLRYNVYRERIERLSGWLEDQVVSGHVFEKMKEIRNRRITDAMILRPVKEGKSAEDEDKEEELGPMEIYLNQDAERRARQLIQHSGVVPASLESLRRQRERKQDDCNLELKEINNNDNSIDVIESWISSGMIPGEDQLNLPKEYNEWKMQKLTEKLVPDIRLRKKLLEDSLKKVKPIPVEGLEIQKDEMNLGDENILEKNFETSVIFAPPLIVPEIKVKSPSKMMATRGRSPEKKTSPKKIGIDMKEIARVVVKQVQDTLEATIENTQNEIEEKIDSLNDHLRQLEDKTNILLEKSAENSPKLEIKRTETINEKTSLPSKKPNPSLLSPIKKKMEVPVPLKKKASKVETVASSHEKVSVKFSQYFSMFKKKILKSYERMDDLYRIMRPDTNGEISHDNFAVFLKELKIPGGVTEHSKLFDELRGQNNNITKLSLFKKIHPLYEAPDPTLEDFVKLLDEMYEGYEGELDRIWQNYIGSAGAGAASNSEKLIGKIMEIRKDLGLEKIQEEEEKENEKRKEREKEEEKERIRKEKERKEEEERERIRKEEERKEEEEKERIRKEKERKEEEERERIRKEKERKEEEERERIRKEKERKEEEERERIRKEKERKEEEERLKEEGSHKANKRMSSSSSLSSSSSSPSSSSRSSSQTSSHSSLGSKRTPSDVSKENIPELEKSSGSGSNRKEKNSSRSRSSVTARSSSSESGSERPSGRKARSRSKTGTTSLSDSALSSNSESGS
ncbi:cAMP/cGMP/EF-hand domain containing protein, partial [Cryptosporidium felis]